MTKKNKSAVKPPSSRFPFFLLFGLLIVGLLLGGGLWLVLDQDRTAPQKTVVKNWDLDGDIAAFRRDCVEGVIKGGDILPTCQSFAAMQGQYGVNPALLLDVELGKMIMTARRIARGDLLTPEDLKECIARDLCREIPLIPPKYQDNEKVANSPKGLKVRRLFWHLVNDGSLTREICTFIDYCKAYYRLGLIRFDTEQNNADNNQ